MEFYKMNNIKPVWTPTYSSWLNIIEPHFGELKKFTINGSDDPDHKTRRNRIQKYLRLRNRKVNSHRNKLNQLFNY